MAKAPTKTAAVSANQPPPHLQKAIPAAGRTVTAKDNQPPLEETLRAKHAPIFARLDAWLIKAQKAAKKLEPKTLADVEKLEAIFVEGRDIANDGAVIRVAEKEEPFEKCKKIDGVFNDGLRDVIGVDPKKKGLAAKIAQAAADQRLVLTRAVQKAQADEEERVREEARKLEARAEEVKAGGDVRVAEVIANQAEAVHQAADKLGAQAAAPVAQASRSFIGTGGGVSVNVNAKLVCTGIIRADLDLNALRPFLKEEVLIAAVNALIATGEKTVKGAVIEEQAKSKFGR